MSKRTWITEGFDAFRRGTFGNGGQNIYVSKKGILQRIFQYDLNHNGYVDLVYANCQNHGESAPSYVYDHSTGARASLPGQGSVCGMAADLTGDGYQDIIVTGRYDMAAPFASTDIYFGSHEGYSEKYHVRIPTPWSEDCCHGDFNGKGKRMLAFAMPCYKTVRIFEQTKLNCYEWNGFVDLPIEANLITAADLDGDGYDDLIVRVVKTSETTIYWGGPDGIQVDRKTVLPEIPAEDVLPPEEEVRTQSAMETVVDALRRLQKVRWNGKDCFTFSTGKKMLFFSADSDRNLSRVLDIPVMQAMSVAVGDLDGDGYDDIAIASTETDPEDPYYQKSYIVWNGPDGLDKRSRTVLRTRAASDVRICEKYLLISQSNDGKMYTRNSMLYTYPNFEKPELYEGEDTRRCELFRNPDGRLNIALINHYARIRTGFDQSFIYWGSKDGYSPENMLPVPGHCAVDALTADLNDDGWTELIIANNSENSTHLDHGHDLHFFGPDGYIPEKSTTLKAEVGWGVVAGDFDHDGYLEVATPANHWKEIRIFSARDDFKSYEVVALPEGASARWPAAVDVNQDGWLDLIVPMGSLNSYILWGGPDGFSIERSTELATQRPIGATAADLTKNGYPDVIIGGHTETPKDGELTPHNPHHSFIYIYWNGPDGLSESRKCVLRGDAADHFVVADFNNDGWLDIFSGSYHGGKDRDVNSFLYWNREGQFHELDRDLLYTHSSSGCMAADFNEDGYIDLAVANHKVDGDHHGYSTVWWNSKDGFNPKNVTNLPTNGPHGMISTEIGNIMDRSNSEYYYSEPLRMEKDGSVIAAYADGDVPPKTAVNITVRVNGGDWVKPESVFVRKGDTLEYRAELYAYNCLRTPRIERITVEIKE